MRHLSCPGCQERLVRNAREGGVILKNRYVRITDTEPPRIVVACSKCARELTIGTSIDGRLVLRQAIASD